jgi:hypothetical protein
LQLRKQVISLVNTIIKAGVCGFTTRVTAESDDSQNVTFGIEKDCENIKKLADALPVVDGYAEIGAGFEGEIHRAVQCTLKGCCSGCAVPAGIFKSMQVAAGLALPAPVAIYIEKT